MMLRNGNPFFVDYQGGRKGALQYDIASCSSTPRPTCRPNYASIFSITISMRSTVTSKIERNEFLHHYYAYVYVRIMQALGAYGFRGFYETKAHIFCKVFRYALKNLRWLLHNVEVPVATANA